MLISKTGNIPKNQKDETNSLSFTARIYFLKSSLFWISFSLFFYFYLYNPYYGSNVKLKLTSSYSLFFHSALVILLTLFFSAIIGILISIPAIVLKRILIFKLNKRKNRGQKPVILIFITKYSPLFFLYLSNILFLLFNFSVSPEIMTNILSEKNFIVLASKKLNHVFFDKNIDKFYEYGVNIGKKFPKNSEFIFLLPDYIINNSQLFKKTKILLENNGEILITNSFKSDTVSSLLNLYPPGYYKLYTPIPFDLPNKPKADKTIYLGVDAEYAYDFFWLFNSYAQVEEIGLTWFDIFLNKYAFSQPQLLYFFKCGFAGFISPLWKWSNIYASNSNLLQKYSIDLIQSKNSSMNKFVFYLTGFEENKEKKLITQFTNKNKNYSHFMNELKKDDLYLAQTIGGLIFSGAKNITLLPYIVEPKEISFHTFYSYKPINTNISLYENIISSHNLENQVTPKNVKSIIQQNNLLDREPQIGCHLKILDFNYDKKESNLINKLKYQSEFIFFDSKYEFYIKNKIQESFLCYFKEAAFFIEKNKTEFNPSNFNYGENFSKIFHPYIEKNSFKKQDKLKNSITNDRIQEFFIIEFFKRFKVYKIEKNIPKLSLLQNNQEKESFFKNYGNNVINEMFKFSSK